MYERNRRVLHVLDNLTSTSGVASVVVQYITAIQQIKQDVVVYDQCDTSIEKTINNCGGKVYKLPHIEKNVGLSFLTSFSKLLSEEPFSVVHGHLINSAFLYLNEAKRKKIPNRVIHAHSAIGADTLVKTIRNKLLSTGVSRWATHCLAASHEASNYAYGNKKKKQVNIIYNGIDCNRFRFDSDTRVEVRNELQLSNDILCIGHVGRLAELKNHQFLFDVYKIIQEKTKCILVLAGVGYLENELKEKVKRMGLLDSIRFLGLRKDIERVYQAFDIFIMPSLSEGFGLAAVEAQCAGLPCVLSEHIPCVVDCGEKVEFLPLKNKLLWADVTIKLASLPRSDGVANVKKAKLDSKSTCKKIYELYKSMIDNEV